MKTEKFNYFDAFDRFAEKAFLASELLRESLSEFSPETSLTQMDKIHEIEHEADSIKHTVIEHLSREFVAPIEREDILSLVSEFDNVVDGIDDVMRQLCMYRIRVLRPDTDKFTCLLVEACAELKKLSAEFADFRKSKKIKDIVIRINTIEAEADTLHFNAISELFGAEHPAGALLAWRSIYDALEDCFDNCEHASEIVEEIILKNS